MSAPRTGLNPKFRFGRSSVHSDAKPIAENQRNQREGVEHLREIAVRCRRAYTQTLHDRHCGSGLVALDRAHILNVDGTNSLLFGIEYDHGDSLGGYLVPDGLSEVASVVIADGDSVLLRMPCNEIRESVRDARRHDTGMVGFRIDDAIVPNLISRRNLTVHDAKNGVLIYRRLPYMPPVNKKVMRLETQIIPAVAFDREIGKSFHYSQSGLDRFGHETVQQSFHLGVMSSIYLSGRILIRNYEEFIENKFDFIGLFFDPYYELAMRIYAISKMSKSRPIFLSERDAMIFSPAAEYFAGIDFTDQDSVRRSCRKLPEKVKSVLRSPYVRQLTSTHPEQQPDMRSIAAAIDILSRFTIVGHTNDIFSYVNAVSELLEVPLADVAVPNVYMPIQNVADELRGIAALERLLEEDLIFDHYLREAISSVPGRV